ncbi:aspartate carbamoyltransferase [Candidatus Falkowbacteria bacterium]|nr:aspartate carbamoyltransferase [Candidatus Falkowbacteria bacterium]
MLKLDGVIEAQQFDKETLGEIFRIADRMKKNPPADLLKGKILATLFYEPSTRTRFSFEAAMFRLGGGVISTENAREFSSKAKGESLEDSVRVVSGYADVIVLRYHKEGGAKRAQTFSSVPIINAGDGAGQHPTQALLDLYTIKKCFREIRGLNIALVGDLLNGRTVRSLCYFLAKHYSDNSIFFVSPSQTRMKDDIKEYLNKYGVKWIETDELIPLLPDIDVIYQTRVQKERFEGGRLLYEEIIKASEKLMITKKTLEDMKERAIIMHPLPRLTEISYAVDEDPRAVYFSQAENGLYVRMALLKMTIRGY